MKPYPHHYFVEANAAARASKLEWSDLRCHAEGMLDRVERVTRFVRMRIQADLTLPLRGNAETGRRRLEKAEKSCLFTNSLDLEVEPEARLKLEG